MISKVKMDVQNFYNLKHWLDYSSFTLNLESCVILNNSLLVLQNDNHFTKTFFWGCIQGIEADYYISFGCISDAITDAKFFYSDDYQNWKLLPIPQPEHLILTELCKRPFQGDPGLVIEVIDDAPEEEVTTEEEQEQLESTNGELKEEDRLAAVVQIISEEAMVIPRGALFKQTDSTVVHSQAFQGLSTDDADQPNSFLHYRKPRYEWNTNLLTRVDYNYAMDFLDTIDKDIPSDIWSAQLVEGDRAIVLHNLAWQGFMFFHHLCTPSYGSIYVGTGQHNMDLPFMTQTQITHVSEEIKISTMSVVNQESSVTNLPSMVKELSEPETNQKDIMENVADEHDVLSEIITSA